MIYKTKTITLEDRIRFFWLLVTVSLSSLVLYVYAVNATARHVALRQDLENGVIEASAQIATLQYSYLSMQQSITLDKALSYGFSEVKNPLYVSRTSSAGSLTFNH